MTTKSILYGNLKAFAKCNDLNLGDIERAIGSYPGYFSRHTKRIDFDTVQKVSAYTGISIDDLMNKDLATHYEEEAYCNTVEKVLTGLKKEVGVEKTSEILNKAILNVLREDK